MSNDKKILISLGRSFGSGGLDFAVKLHEALGIPVFDKGILDKAAMDSNIRKELFEEADENSKISIPYICGGSFPMTAPFFAYTDSYISTETLFTKQSEAIKKIASESSAIFVGRCSDFVLRDDYPQMLSLFVTDDPSVRVKTIMERLGIASEEEAKSVMEKADQQRREYYNYYTSGHWGRADNYDLCIKLSVLGMERAVQMVCSIVNGQ